MAEHTREPWEYHADSRFVIAHIDDGEGLLICEVTDTHEGLEGDCPAADANGHLLAAASDLLAACREMREFIRTSKTKPGETPYDILCRASFAIAKAMGKEGVA